MSENNTQKIITDTIFKSAIEKIFTIMLKIVL